MVVKQISSPELRSSGKHIAWGARLPNLVVWILVLVNSAAAQDAPYEYRLPVEPPYYRVRFDASSKASELAYPVSFTIWIPPSAKQLRGLIVHQHGCGEGSCKSGQTGAFDLHWQALAMKHNCALLAPVYEQPEGADCQLWCDPRHGSDRAFQQALVDLGAQSGHPELAIVPWAIWGHSGGGHWAGGMLLLHADRVAAVWLRSGVPALESVEGKPKPYAIPEAACQVPVMCNLGTAEGVTIKDGRFAGVWGGVEAFFRALRAKDGLVGVAIDPLTSHECGNQRYLAIPWFDACLAARLPDRPGDPQKVMPVQEAWLAPLIIGDTSVAPVPASEFQGAKHESVWLPSATLASAWLQYITDTAVSDATPPPAPTHVTVRNHELSWEAEADLESGIAKFLIERDGQFLANVPAESKNPFGRTVFQNLQYSDTPTQPLVQMRFTDPNPVAGQTHQYRVIAVNTVGLQSM